jgi:hypothetical protein
MSAQPSTPAPTLSAASPALPLFHANVCRISGTLEEFVLEFGFRVPVPGSNGEPIQYVCRVVLPPSTPREMVAALLKIFAHHDAIHNAPGHPTPGAGQPGAASG